MRRIGIGILAATLVACSGGEVEVHSSAEEDATEEQATELRDAVQAPLDRASAVQDTAATRKADLDAALEAAAGDSDDDP